MQLGRVQASVSEVLGEAPSEWAMPCFPFTGAQAGMYVLPGEGTGVWVEFEQGDPAHPIWSGCWYGSAAEVPALALGASVGSSPVVIQTAGGNALVMSAAGGPAGAILLTTAAGAMISIGANGIMIENGLGASIALLGPSVEVNGVPV
ncbi:MAG: phage baseplate assembly protein V [Actinomycetota bacterium]|nr:phage baseplate assembly protein V [Actinomycetota bacterium]